MKETKSVILTVKVEPSLKDKIDDAAEENNLNPSEWVRAVVKKKLKYKDKSNDVLKESTTKRNQ